MWVMAFIGFVFFGYKTSYIEYYDPETSRRRIADATRKQDKGR